MTFTVKASIANFGGKLLKLTHQSSVLSSEMQVNVFLPSAAAAEVESNSGDKKFPVLLYLSGLTCTPENCSEKGFFQPWAEKHGIVVVYPDTSPRGGDLPGENDSYDFGSGAGFYLNATEEPWSKRYNMYDYITEELPKELFAQYAFLDSSRVSITGHSMGGHGALTLFLKNPGAYKSVSAFAPITNPTKAPWGIKAFSGYLGEANKDKWADYDATELLKKYSGPTPEILIDVGLGDNFYQNKQLLPENFAAAAESSVYKDKVHVRYQDGYDHSYFFISSFAKDHLEHAAKYLTK